MKRALQRLALFALGSCLTLGVLGAHAAPPTPWVLAGAAAPDSRTSTPDNGPIRRINPNSRQGTESISPSVRTPGAAPANPRPPTLENGGIRNGYPTRQPAPGSNGRTR